MKMAVKALKSIKTPLWLIFALATSSCATGGPRACPPPAKIKLDPLSEALMQPPQYKQRLSAEFFGSETMPTTKSAGSKPN